MRYEKVHIDSPNPYGKLSLERLSEFERTIGTTLPPSYRRLLVETNGGAWKPKQFLISESEGETLIHYVFGLHDGPSYLRLDINWSEYKGRIPREVIAIASDAGGNKLCICIDENCYGKVFFWDHESNEGEQLSKLTQVAASMEDFFNLFHSEEYKDIADRIIKEGDTASLAEMLDSGELSIDTRDEHGRTLIERAAIQAKTEIILHLFNRGADIGSSLLLAKQNAKFFDQHKPVVELLESLEEQGHPEK